VACSGEVGVQSRASRSGSACPGDDLVRGGPDGPRRASPAEISRTRQAVVAGSRRPSARISPGHREPGRPDRVRPATVCGPSLARSYRHPPACYRRPRGLQPGCKARAGTMAGTPREAAMTRQARDRQVSCTRSRTRGHPRLRTCGARDRDAPTRTVARTWRPAGSRRRRDPRRVTARLGSPTPGHFDELRRYKPSRAGRPKWFEYTLSWVRERAVPHARGTTCTC